MPIFRLERLEEDDMSKAELVIAQETNLELERHLEDWLENSPHALVENESILWIGRQTSATDEDGTIYSDLFGVDFQGNLVIAELKKGRTPRDIIAQILDYAAWAVGLSESEIREIAEAYFENRGEFEGKTFDDAFKEVFEIPETDELPPLNRVLRLFIVTQVATYKISRMQCLFFGEKWSGSPKVASRKLLGCAFTGTNWKVCATSGNLSYSSRRNSITNSACLPIPPNFTRCRY